jgi:hypothetical protein
MIGIDAFSIVTLVANNFAVRNFAKVKRPGKPMRLPLFLLVLDNAIAYGRRCPRPFNTAGIFVDNRPIIKKLLINRFAWVHHYKDTPVLPATQLSMAEISLAEDCAPLTVKLYIQPLKNELVSARAPM